MTKNKPPLARRLCELRAEKELTQWQLADSVGTHQGRICDYENGRYEPSLPTLRNYADAFGMSVADILQGVM